MYENMKQVIIKDVGIVTLELFDKIRREVQN